MTDQVETNTTSPEVDFDIFLTPQDEAAAFPLFYGQLVKAEYSPPDADGKRKVHTVFKPYAYFIEGEAVPADDIKTKDGCLHDRGSVSPGDVRKGYTFTYKMLDGLKQQRVNVSQTGLLGAVGHEGWFRQVPGRFSNILPQMAPKNAPTIRRPDDWDFEAWVKEFGGESAYGNVTAEATGGADTLILPEEQWDNLAQVVEGKSQAAALRAVAGDKSFAAIEPRSIQATLDAMMTAGFVNRAGGNYHRVVA